MNMRMSIPINIKELISTNESFIYQNVTYYETMETIDIDSNPMVNREH